MKLVMTRIIPLLFLSFMLTAINQVGFGYIELASEKIFSPGEEAYVHIQSYGAKKVGIRVYRLSSPKEYIKGLKNIHYPNMKTKRRAANLFQIKEELSRKLARQWRRFVRNNFSSEFREDLIKGMALKSSAHDKIKDDYYELFPVLKGYKLLKKIPHKIKKGKYYYSYSKIPLGIKKKGIYLVEGVYKSKAAYTVVMISDIAFVTKTYHKGRLVYVTNRRTGKPITDALVEVYNRGRKLLTEGRTDANGVFKYQSKKDEGNKVLIFVESGRDFSLSDPYFYTGYYSPSDACYIYTSRPVYRPGQKVSFKVIARELKNELYQVPEEATQVQVKIKDAKNNELFNKYLTMNDFGSMTGEFNLKKSSKLGTYTITANFKNSNYHYKFKVEKYKKPEYEVKIKTDKTHYIKGDAVHATIKAKYYFGSPVSNGKVEYHVYRSRYYVPWWDTSYSWYYSSAASEGYEYSRRQELESKEDVKINPDGTLKLTIKTKKEDKSYTEKERYYRYKEPDYKYTIVATVVDQSRRHINGVTTFLVTRSDHHLAVSTSRWLYEPNDPIDIKVVAKKFNGQFVKNQKIKLEFYKEVWKKEKGKYKYTEQLLSTKTAVSNERGVLSTSYTVDKPMSLIVKAISKDPYGNITYEKRYIYVYGGGYAWDRGARSGIDIIADKSNYKLGDKAKLVFNTPAKKGHLLVTVESTSIPYYKVLPIDNGKVDLNLELLNEFTPNAWITGTIIFNNKLYQSSKEVIIPPVQQFIKVEVISDKKQYKPGEQAQFIIKASDYKGRPVKSEISIGVVDAAVYAIAPERTLDIRRYFYGRKYNRVSTTSSLYFRFAGEFQNKQLMSYLGKKNRDFAYYKEDEQLVQPKVRKNFKDEIVWLPTVNTNSDGEAEINFNFPDNLTRWRTTVRAITKNTQVGNVVHKTIVRKNLLIRLALPRFYREMDNAVVSTIVHNYLSSPKKVNISLSGKGIKVLSQNKKEVRIPKNGELRIDWDIKAEKAGSATFLAKALSNEESDAVQKSIPVLPHGLPTIDTILAELRKPVDKFIHTLVFKDNFIPNFTSLKIDLAPSVVVAMNSAIPYLVKEPYGCVEQTMSRFLPLVLVDDIVKKIGYKDVALRNKIDSYSQSGSERLYRLQHSDGGWGWWTDDATHPYMSAYALSGLLLAKKVGRNIKADVIKKGLSSVETQMNKVVDLTTKVFMLRTLTLGNKGSSKVAANLYRFRRKLNPYGKAMLAEILNKQGEKVKAQNIMQELIKEAKTDSLGAYWQGKGWRYNWQDDSEETTANALRAITLIDSDQDIISQGVRWIMGQRRDSHWRSTKSTAIMIHALYDIAQKRKELAPNYKAQVFLNNELFQNLNVDDSQKSLKTYSFVIPEKDLKKGMNHLKITKKGEGSLYYSSTFKYFERADWLTSKDNGFSIKRKYYRLVKQVKKGEVLYMKIPVRDRVLSGDIILVELEVDLKRKRREYVLIEDNLPSGCEVVKNDRGYSVIGSDRYKGYKSWNERYYAAREVHDERVGIARTYVWNPNFKIEYLIRAEIPGEYRAMPAQVSLMYYPEVNGRSNEFKLRVLDKK